jgi:uncharacterized protein (DUF2141 family)
MLCAFQATSGVGTSWPPGNSGANARVTITVDNVRNSKGVVGVLAFNSSVGWPEKVDRSYTKTSVPARRGVTSVVIGKLSPGPYAFVVLHDENENMKLDKNAFGKPKEGWGMSNNPTAFSRAPSFNKARVLVDHDVHLRVHLHYY